MNINYRLSFVAAFAAMSFSSIASAESAKEPSLKAGNYGVSGQIVYEIAADGAMNIDGTCSVGSLTAVNGTLQLFADPDDSDIEFITFTGTSKSRIEIGPETPITLTLSAKIPHDQESNGTYEPTTWTLTTGTYESIAAGGTTVTFGATAPRILCGG